MWLPGLSNRRVPICDKSKGDDIYFGVVTGTGGRTDGRTAKSCITLYDVGSVEGRRQDIELMWEQERTKGSSGLQPVTC
jgi:hypothetical protein